MNRRLPWIAAACAAATAAIAADGPPSPADELRVWRDPAFRRRLLDDAAVRTDVEPRMTEVERAQMEKILPLLGAPKTLPVGRRLLEQAATATNGCAAFDFMLGHTFFLANEPEAAAAWYERATAKFSSFLRAWKQLGVALVRAGRFDRAAAALGRAIELGATDGTTYGLLGFAHMQTERHASAETAYRLAVMLQPQVMDWRLGLARCLFKQGRYAEAAALCDEMIRMEPDRPEYRVLQANAYLGMKQTAKAVEVYEQLDLVGQATAEALQTLGDIHVNDGYLDLAADAYRRALEKRAEAPERALRNAEVLAARGAHDLARELAGRIRAVGGERLDAAARKRLLKLEARAAAARGAPAEEQVALLQEIAALDPLDGEALILLAQHHAGAGRLEEAVLLFERAAAIESSEAEARLRHAQALVRAARYAEAVPLLKRAQELRPRDDVARYLEQVERMARARR